LEGKAKTYNAGEEKHTATFSQNIPLIPLLLTCPRDRQALIFDPFSGTATTGQVALALGHRYVGAELYEKNVKISTRILSQFENDTIPNLYDEIFESDGLTNLNIAA
jgi:DNA modification methylase